MRKSPQSTSRLARRSMRWKESSRLMFAVITASRSEEHTSELQSPCNLVCRLLLEEKKKRHPVVHTARRLGSGVDLRQRDHKFAPLAYVVTGPDQLPLAAARTRDSTVLHLLRVVPN